MREELNVRTGRDGQYCFDTKDTLEDSNGAHVGLVSGSADTFSSTHRVSRSARSSSSARFSSGGKKGSSR